MASSPSLQDQILSACSSSDIPRLRSLLHRQDQLILEEAAISGTVDVVRYLLDRHSTFENLEQHVLESAAASGNVAVLRYVLERNPTLDVISQTRPELRYGGWSGGLEGSFQAQSRR
ncbi:MAG: hypothetical protein M1830_009076 [Pleopsidium flavum]|nr:MAG: hypothetical protein M1830_009076 [Pleopsidium flavum]